MSLVEYAKQELARIKHDEDGMQDMMDKCVLDLIQVLEDQGHSNTTVHYCLAVFERLARFKPLTPLTGEDDEWNEVSEGLFQNKRYSAVFKRGKDGKAYDIGARMFSDDDGETWYTSKNSRVYIEFPYNVPDKPEKVYVIKKGDYNGK